MVMVTYWKFSRGVAKRKISYTARARGGADSGSPPLCLRNVLRLREDCLPLRVCNPIQDLVHGLLDTGIGFMEFPRSLRRKLAEHISVTQSL
jgi:hypothetical protein